ncbi:ornithine cyclodeaminase family protein [Thalassobius sp. I31.1]|uniref:ornithine cyclodeaminase family protein n=1 Tax=Thalassobius sp. I31.1 TaxID=2109912 RepID=UPI000D1A2D5B|nr:ornithine cyclodeaminase family protein [Thalassobius sp. I31.1]
MNTSPLVLDAKAVEQVLPQLDILGEMRSLFTALGEGKAVQPSQTLTLLPGDTGDFITYLGAETGSGVFGAKLSPYLVKPGKPVITAWTTLMSSETGQPLLLCDSGRLTTERTAATTALAVDFLAQPSSRKLAIIGTGAVALAHWQYVQDLRNWDEVCIYSPGLTADEARQQSWQNACPGVQLATTAEDAAKDADVIMLCTSSGTPVLDMSAVGQDTLVTSISTNVAKAHEIAPAFLNTAQVYCDYRATTPGAAGEMQLAAQDHGWQVEALKGDLAELATGTCATPEKGSPVFFRSIGLGLEDIAVAHAVYRAAMA